ncbi:hypothetical protein [Phaeospirillum tilakii]|uniref:Uncharacterized protein n=1 Tax=Phaeospirillum tilakii TaxID=741673 RepID=A0ABW5CG39_9PROT
MIDMPDRLSDLLFRFLHQNNDTLSQRARDKEFAGLTDEKARRIESIYADAFPGE